MADYFCTFCGCRHEPLAHVSRAARAAGANPMPELPTSVVERTRADAEYLRAFSGLTGVANRVAEAANTIMDLLVRLYRLDAVETARLCDEELDRSGKLLGEVREMANVA